MVGLSIRRAVTKNSRFFCAPPSRVLIPFISLKHIIKFNLFDGINDQAPSLRIRDKEGCSLYTAKLSKDVPSGTCHLFIIGKYFESGSDDRY